MGDSTKPIRRRGRRSTRVSQRLEEARRRNAAQLAKQREQEKVVEAALAEFFDAGDRIAVAEEDCQRRVEPHERAIARLRQQRDELVAAQEEAQSLAALAIHEADRTVEQVGELLGLGEKAARRLIAAGREANHKRQAGGGVDVGTTRAAARRDHGDDRRRGEQLVSAPDGAGAESLGRETWSAADSA